MSWIVLFNCNKLIHSHKLWFCFQLTPHFLLLAIIEVYIAGFFIVMMHIFLIAQIITSCTVTITQKFPRVFCSSNHFQHNFPKGIPCGNASPSLSLTVSICQSQVVALSSDDHDDDGDVHLFHVRTERGRRLVAASSSSSGTAFFFLLLHFFTVYTVSTFSSVWSIVSACTVFIIVSPSICCFLLFIDNMTKNRLMRDTPPSWEGERERDTCSLWWHCPGGFAGYRRRKVSDSDVTYLRLYPHGDGGCLSK